MRFPPASAALPLLRSASLRARYAERGTSHVRDAREAHGAFRHGGEDLGGDRAQTLGKFLVALRFAVERGREVLHENGRVRHQAGLEVPADGVLELHALADRRIEPPVRKLFQCGRPVDSVGRRQ